MNRISFAILLACNTSCVTRITFTPIELTFFNILSITLVDWGSRLLQGSSNSSKLGLIINALIIANNCCCPIDNFLADSSLKDSKFDIDNITNGTPSSSLEKDVHKIARHYMSINTGDAQGYVTWDRYKRQLKDNGAWNDINTI